MTGILLSARIYFNPFPPFFWVVIYNNFFLRLFINAAKQVQTNGDVLGCAEDEVDENWVEGGVKPKDGWD